MMHALRCSHRAVVPLLAAWATLTSNTGVLAGPIDRRTDPTTSTSSSSSSSSTSTSSTSASATAGQLAPWVSVSNGVPVTTVTPQLTTIAGTPTTLNPEPASTGPLTGTTTTSGASKTSSTAGSTPSPLVPSGSGAFTECHNPDGPFHPFCKPGNGTDLYVGDSYYITWDPTPFPANSTVTILLNYVDVADARGLKAWGSDAIQSNYGFASITMDNAWRHDAKANNLTFSLVELDPAPTSRPRTFSGPTVRLVEKPLVHIPPPPPTPAPNKLGLLVGLPVSLGAVLLIVFGLFFLMRRTRRIGVGNVMGRRKPYRSANSKARRARLRAVGGGGNPRGPADDDGFEFQDSPSHAQFRDEPTHGPGGVELTSRARDGAPQLPKHGAQDSLGSLVGSPAREGFGDDAPERRGGNAFREEIERQRRI